MSEQQPATVAITPRPRTRAELAAAPARLATTMLEVAVAGSADSGRFRRGREYVAGDAVRTLVVSPGVVQAEVSGSRQWTYSVEARVALGATIDADPSTSAGQMALMPEPDDVTTSCTCPDLEEPCKHAVAALLALAAEIGERPALLALWRGMAPGERKTVGSRAATAPRTPAPPATAPWESPQWQEFLGAADAIPVFDPILAAPAPSGHEVVDGIDVGAIVTDAREVLSRSRFSR